MDAEGKRLHICSICKKEDIWTEDWTWFGSFKDLDEEPDAIQKFCGKVCADKFKAKRVRLE